ncbi:Hypothetical protein R9X50_00053900 [Acrodontium crateriforme]|uniref:Copper acquisition factor BIM1-like domain-containing protein n=1 Tax=Acrodontium crateriforme TaxID=150365 RepID=A0AAQ3LXP2_9PEZI|nr:Hypothetical protein R9X50_00053900 [Acrodontium crateriforme]
MLSKSLLVLAATASLASAHFILYYPPTAGFDDDNEPNGPCGGATVQVNSSSPQIQVDRFAISIFSSHPTGSWTFRGTTDTEEPYNFVDITPNVNTTGAGVFCLSEMRAPSEWAGKAGIIQVIDASVDGTLYQCAPVNFVDGSNSTIGSNCHNQTSSFTASWLGSSNSSSASSSSSTTTAAATGSAASNSGTASSTSSHGGAAMATMMGSLAGGLGMLAAGFAL